MLGFLFRPKRAQRSAVHGGDSCDDYAPMRERYPDAIDAKRRVYAEPGRVWRVRWNESSDPQYATYIEFAAHLAGQYHWPGVAVETAVIPVAGGVPPYDMSTHYRITILPNDAKPLDPCAPALGEQLLSERVTRSPNALAVEGILKG